MTDLSGRGILDTSTVILLGRITDPGFLPVEPSTDPDVIVGVAASPGTVQGTASVHILIDPNKNGDPNKNP